MLRLPLTVARPLLARSLTTTAPAPSLASVIGSSSSGGPGDSAGIVSLRNIENAWTRLSKEEQMNVHNQLEEIQKRDWKELSFEERKAAYYVAFGPHGPRKPTSKPGDNLKIFASVLGLLGVAGLLFATARHFGGAPEKTMTKEWQEATNTLALEKNMNPISGLASEGYKGKGFVQSK